MALIIPKSVGGDADAFEDAPVVQPIEERASSLIIPADVGGAGESLAAPTQPVEDEAAQPLSQLIPEAIKSLSGDALSGELGAIPNPFGGVSTEKSITITDPRVNQGRATNIPQLVTGQSPEAIERILTDQGTREDEEVAILRAIQRVSDGQSLPDFNSIDEAVSAARKRSDAGGSIDKFQEAGIADIFTGSERIAATPELGTLPELFSTEEGLNLSVAAGLLSTMDEKAQRDIIQEAIPQAVFETTPDGATIIEIPTEEGGVRRSVLNRPGFSPQDLRAATGQVMAFVPAAKLAGLGKSLLQKVGIGALASGGTEQALQEVGVELGRKERDPVATAIAAGTGGLAEVAVPAVQAIRGARQTARAGVAQDEITQVAESVRAAQEATEQTGVPLFQAQQTGIPAQLEKQSFVAQLPAGTRSSMEGLKSQNKAAGDAVEEFLGQIAPDAAVVTGAEQMRTAAQTAVAATKRARSEAASPIYKQAFRRQRQGKTGPIDLDTLNTKISSMSAQFEQKGQIAKNLNSALDKIENAGGDLNKLHLAKTEIDQTINSFGADSVGNTTKRFLTDVKNDLTEELVSQSPSYRAARDEFIRLSPEVTRIQDSIVGKIASLDDTQLKQVTSKIFDPSNTVKNVSDAKKAITDVSPEAWDAIIRNELERRLGSIKSTAEAGTVENIPGQLFRALFPNDKSTKVLMRALDDNGRKNLKYLETALGRARLGRPGGSQTAAREEIKRELRGGIFQSLRNFLKAPVSTLASTGEDAAFNQRTSALAKALFDPTWKAEMKKLRTFSPDSPAAARAFTQLFNDIEGTEPNIDQTEN